MPRHESSLVGPPGCARPGCFCPWCRTDGVHHHRRFSRRERAAAAVWQARSRQGGATQIGSQPSTTGALHAHQRNPLEPTWRRTGSGTPPASSARPSSPQLAAILGWGVRRASYRGWPPPMGTPTTHPTPSPAGGSGPSGETRWSRLPVVLRDRVNLVSCRFSSQAYHA